MVQKNQTLGHLDFFISLPLNFVSITLLPITGILKLFLCSREHILSQSY